MIKTILSILVTAGCTVAMLYVIAIILSVYKRFQLKRQSKLTIEKLREQAKIIRKSYRKNKK